MSRAGRQLTRKMTTSSTATTSTASDDIDDNDDDDGPKRAEAKRIFSRYTGQTSVEEEKLKDPDTGSIGD